MQTGTPRAVPCRDSLTGARCAAIAAHAMAAAWCAVLCAAEVCFQLLRVCAIVCVMIDRRWSNVISHPLIEAVYLVMRWQKCMEIFSNRLEAAFSDVLRIIIRQ